MENCLYSYVNDIASSVPNPEDYSRILIPFSSGQLIANLISGIEFLTLFLYKIPHPSTSTIRDQWKYSEPS